MKAKLFICVIAALFVFSGASPWEGAAAIAPEGELPAAGRYIATNSFPRNTIVDITNIETNRSTRVIVSNSLNSPGLLAIVSRDAAELIGMRAGSISRIRMVQPSDPIAYLRFTEGINAGIPEYDSGNVVTEEKLLDEIYRRDTYTPPAVAESSRAAAVGTGSAPAGNTPGEAAPGGVAPEGVAAGGDAPVEAQEDRVRGPRYVLEPEWTGQGRNIIDLPGYIVYPEPERRLAEPVARPAEPVTETPAPAAVTAAPEEKAVALEEAPRAVEPPTEPPRDEVIKNIAVKAEEPSGNEVIKDFAGYAAEAPREEAKKDVPEYLADTSVDELEKEVPAYAAEASREEVEKDIPEYIAESVREEAEKDVPEKTEAAPVEEVAANIPERPEERAAKAERLAPTEELAQAEAPRPEEREYNLVPTQERPPQNNTIYGIDPSEIIPPVANAPPEQAARPAVAPVTAPTSAPAVADAAFSIPRIYELDRGCYYVQVAALDSPDLVEDAVRQIDRSYQPKVYRDGDDRYRVLLGPLNQGESAAVLQRFRSIGFKDAFVRRGG